MIMSHGLKVIFVKTKKVGGTSFEIALSKYCNDDDIVCKISEKDDLIRSELGFQGPVNFRERSREKYRDPRYGKDHPNARIGVHIQGRASARSWGRVVALLGDPLLAWVRDDAERRNSRGPALEFPKTWCDSLLSAYRDQQLCTFESSNLKTVSHC